MNGKTAAAEAVKTKENVSAVWVPTVVLLGLFWLLIWNQQRLEWTVNAVYSYGWAVPFLAVFLLWERWRRRPTEEDPPAAALIRAPSQGAFFSRRKPGAQALVGTAIAVAGVVTIVMHTRTLSGTAQPLFIAAILAATVGWSFGTLMQKRAARAETVLSFTCVQMFAGGLFQLLMAAVTGEFSGFDPSTVSLASMLGVLYLIVFGSLIALNCYLWLLTRVSAPKVTTYALVNPVVALLLGALFLNERVTVLALIAAALVLVGVALVLFQDLGLSRLFRGRSEERAPGNEVATRRSAKSESA